MLRHGVVLLLLLHRGLSLLRTRRCIAHISDHFARNLRCFDGDGFGLLGVDVVAPGVGVAAGGDEEGEVEEEHGECHGAADCYDDAFVLDTIFEGMLCVTAVESRARWYVRGKATVGESCIRRAVGECARSIGSTVGIKVRGVK